MENGNRDGSDENTDELLSADVNEEGGHMIGSVPLSLPHDHCDFLLDAIDAQLSRLQTQSHSHMHGGHSKKYEFPVSGYLDRNQSLSKDTGLGSSVPTNDKAASTPDRAPSEGKGDKTEDQTVELLKAEAPVKDACHPDRDQMFCGLNSVSRREQCCWRLEKLLGRSTEVVGMGNEDDNFTMDSICTEDFSTRFRDEMLELPGTAPAPDALINSSDTADITETQRSPHPETSKIHLQYPPITSIKHLAGIPMQSFDSVTIDTDLDTVCSVKVRQHLKSALSNRTGLNLYKEHGLSAGQHIKNKLKSFSSDEEGTVEELSGEGSMLKLYSRSRRHPAGRKQKRRSSQQGRRNDSSTVRGRSEELNPSSERPQDNYRIDEGHLKELRMSLLEIQLQKSAVLQSLEKLREEMDQAKREQLSLQLSVRDGRAQSQNVRCELHRLQAQRELCLEEVKFLQEQQVSLVQRQKSALNHDTSSHSYVRSSVSVLEREEMDRLLDKAKSELFSEQRRFRHTLDSMQEKLDELNQELEQREENCRALRQKCNDLENQLSNTIREREQTQETLQQDLKEQVSRVGSLERMVAQKDVALLGMEEERKALHLKLSSLREEHSLKLTEVQKWIQKEKEQEIEQLILQLTKKHKEELQMMHQQVEEMKSAALSEQDQSHKQSIDSLHNCIQMKDEQVKRFKEALEQQEEKMRRQAKKLREETEEKIQKAVRREERKWEEQTDKILKEQRGMLKKQLEEAVKKERTEVEKERRNTLALQSKVIELQAKAEEEAAHLKQSLQWSEKELQDLKIVLAERDQEHQRATARHEQQSRHWAVDIHTECVTLQELLKHNDLTVESRHLSDSPTVNEALQTLQSLTKPLQQLITDLQNEISSERHSTLQLSKEKDQELLLQKEKLIEDKEQALIALREKLIQEHIEEMSSLTRAQLHMGDDDAHGLLAHLRRQLKAKDDELRQVQKNMAQWKDKTTARLARKFELELTAELERRVPNHRAEQQKRLERLENEMRLLTGQCGDYKETKLYSSALQNGPDVPHAPHMQDLTSYKLLQHLQGRIRQLQAEIQSPCPSPVKWDRETRDLGGSYLDTIDPAQGSFEMQSQSPAKTIPS